MDNKPEWVTPAVSNSTRREDAILLVLCAWLLGGLFLDGYAHVYVIDTETEDFFTPWHAIFYAAFTAVLIWVGVIAYRRRAPGKLIDWFPASHRPTVVGVILFALGGLGDAIWHTIFGVEVGVDALLSPTHLLLLTGGLLVVWTPVRAAAARGDASPWLPIGAVTGVTAVLTFFIEYLWLLPWPWFPRQPFDPVTEHGVGLIQQFLGSTVAMVVVLVTPLLMIARRWVLPFGAATIAWTAAAILEAAAFSQQARPVLLVLLGGLTFDLTMAATRGRSWGLTMASAIGPAVIFASFLIGARIDGPLGWPPEIWGGTVFTAAGVGAGLSMLQSSGAHRPTKLNQVSDI